MAANVTFLADDWINGTNNNWNYTLAPNITTERPYWMNVLDQVSTIIMTCNLVILMLGMGAATHITEVWTNMKRPWGSIIGMLCQFGMLPAIGFGLCIILKLPPYQALGVLILTCSPGGAFSNFFTYWVDGDIALSILMTSTSSLLAFGGMPLNLWIYTSYWTDEQLKIPYLNVLISMCFVTGPAIVGMLIRHFTRTWANRISQLCGILGWVGALTCGAFLILIYWDVITTVSLNVLVAAAGIPVIGFTIAYVISRILCMSNKVCRTIGIETGCQNMVVAVNVMLLSFTDVNIRGQMVIFPTIYGVFQLAEIFSAIIIFQIYKFIHRDDVTEEEVKSVVDTTILTMVPVPMETEIRKSTTWDRNPDLLNGERIVTDRNSSRNVSTHQLSSHEGIPFLKAAASRGEISTEAWRKPNIVVPYYDVIRVGGPMTGRRPSWRRFSDHVDGTVSPENVYDEAKYLYETTATLPIRPDAFNTYSLNAKKRRPPQVPPPVLPPTPRSPSLNTGYEFRTFGSD